MSYSRPFIVINVCYLFVDLSVPSFWFQICIGSRGGLVDNTPNSKTESAGFHPSLLPRSKSLR